MISYFYKSSDDNGSNNSNYCNLLALHTNDCRHAHRRWAGEQQQPPAKNKRTHKESHLSPNFSSKQFLARMPINNPAPLLDIEVDLDHWFV